MFNQTSTYNGYVAGQVSAAYNYVLSIIKDEKTILFHFQSQKGMSWPDFIVDWAVRLKRGVK